MEIATPSGPARIDLDDRDDPGFLLAMTHGANGGVDAPDLRAVRAIALAFPLHPPWAPERSRASELRGAGVERKLGFVAI